MKCIAPEEFVEMMEAGRLDHPSPEVARHLEICAECRDAWSSIGAADDVLPSLRPARRSSFRAAPAIAAALLLLMLGSVLWLGKGDGGPSPGSTLSQDVEKEMLAAIERLKSDDASVREQAEKALVEFARKAGKGSLRWLRDQRKKAAQPEVVSRLTSVVRRLCEPQVLWTATLEDTSFGAIAPAVDARVCVFSSSKFISGVDSRTGKVLWKTDGDYRAYTTVTPGAVLAPVSKGPGVAIRALRPETGEVLWSHGIADLWTPAPENDQGYYHDSPIARSGPWVYTGSRAGSLLCLDAATGKRRWATSGPEGRPSGYFTPVVHDGKVFVSEWGRALVAFDAETGRLLWKVKNPGIGTTSPLIAGGRVFMATHVLGGGKPEQERGEVMAVSPTDGRVLWTTDFGPFGQAAYGLIDAGSMLVVQGKSHLVGLSPETGAVRWSIPAPRWGYITLARDDRGRVYSSTDEGKLLVVESASGKLLLTFDPNTLPEAVAAPKMNYGDSRKTPDLGVAGCPAVLGDTVYFLSQSGFAVALRMSEFMDDPD
jgi:outer membrane protein assembly factor BamB